MSCIIIITLIIIICTRFLQWSCLKTVLVSTFVLRGLRGFTATSDLVVWVQLRGRTWLLGSFYSQAKAIDMAEKSSSSSSSGIDKALEGEPIITWTCVVLKKCLRSKGGRLTGKKRTPHLEADRSLGDEKLVCHLD